MKNIFLVLLAFTCLSAHLAFADTDVQAAPVKAPKAAKSPKAPKEKKPKVDCEKSVAADKEECEKNPPAGYKSIFILDKSDCSWECKNEATGAPTDGPAPKKPAKKVKKVKKVVKPTNDKKSLKAKKTKVLKECNGEKKILFKNCMLSIKGLIAFGDKTKNFDEKFEKFLESEDEKKPAKKPAAKENGKALGKGKAKLQAKRKAKSTKPAADK